MPIRTLFLFGTRPEAIKLCPVLRHLREQPDVFDVRVCVTAQHREMLDQVLDVFGVTPDIDLDLMQPGQTLFASTSRMLAALEPVFRDVQPDLAIVQGDTTTTLCGALAAFYARVPVAHVEAGLRTGDLAQPFPEEMNRVVTGRLTSLHFAATPGAAANLESEGVPAGRTWVTGNSGIDAVLYVRDGLEAGRLRPSIPPPAIAPGRRLVLVTAHRRENFGEPLERVARALQRLASRGDMEIAYPVHPNPAVQGVAARLLEGKPGISLIPPLDYVSFVDWMRRADLLITDSGGVQEEGPSLGKPILVLREKTERPEAVDAGTVELVGTDEDRIVSAATALLDDADLYARRARVHNPYGDGRASERISAAIRSFFER